MSSERPAGCVSLACVVRCVALQAVRGSQQHYLVLTSTEYRVSPT